MKSLYWILTVILLTSITKADTVISYDTPNVGDVTTTVTTNIISTVTTNHTTSNLLTGDFTDGSWNGTSISSRHGSGTIAGIGSKYVASTINQADTGLSDDEVQRGFSSTLGADIWFWDGTQDQSVTMSQIFNDGNGDITTQTRVVDYVNTGFNTYQDTIVIGANTSINGSVTARFDFTHTNTQSHRAADLKNPSLIFDYTKVNNTVSQVSNTTVKYCWEFNPSTCPQAVEEIADTIEIFEEDLKEIFKVIDTPKIEVPVITYEPVKIIIDEPKFEVEIFTVETTDMIPDIETVEILSIDMSAAEIPEEEFNTETMANAYDTELVTETTPEPEADPIIAVEETNEPIKEQPSSEEPIADKPIQETSSPEQEEVIEAEVEEPGPEAIEEPIEETIVEEEPEVIIDIAKVESYIDSKVKNQIEKVAATLEVVSELVSRAMVSNQVDISSYSTINAAMFDNRQLVDGNLNFFNQVVLVGYDKTIYNNQVSMGSTDLLTQHNIKLEAANNETNKAYIKLQELINERNGI